MTLVKKVNKYAADWMHPGEEAVAACRLFLPALSEADDAAPGEWAPGPCKRYLEKMERKRTPLDPDRGLEQHLNKRAARRGRKKGLVLVATPHRVLVMRMSWLGRPKTVIVEGSHQDVRMRVFDDAHPSGDRRVFHVEFPPDSRWLLGFELLEHPHLDHATAVVQTLGGEAERVSFSD